MQITHTECLLVVLVESEVFVNTKKVTMIWHLSSKTFVLATNSLWHTNALVWYPLLF